MQGEGNTSVMLAMLDVFGVVDALHPKGSGWALKVIEAAGRPVR